MSRDRRTIGGANGVLQPPTGHVFRVDRARGLVWFAKCRLPDGRQVQKKIGPAWTERGRPAAGYFTKRLAEDWLRTTLDDARRGTLPGMVRSGATFADAAAEFLRYCEEDRSCEPSTLRDYHSNLNAHMLPTFGHQPVQSVTPAAIDVWRSTLTGLSARTKNKLLVVIHGVFRRAQHVWGLPSNPASGVEKYRQRSSGDIDVFSPEEVMALVRAASSAQDAAIFLTAAYTGLRRGELLALRWRDADFTGAVIRVRTSYAAGQLTTPKSGKVRAVPMAPDVGEALARLGQRRDWTGDDDLVFPGGLRRLSGRLRAAPPLWRRPGPGRPASAALPRPTPHLRDADDRQGRHPPRAGVGGHADIQTTMRYLHYAPRADDAALVADAFRIEEPDSLDRGRVDP